MREAMAQAIREAARARRGSEPVYDGRLVPARNLHVTLVFLGAVPERRLPELAGVARGAADGLGSDTATTNHSPCPLELVFDHLEHWRSAQVLCAAPAEPPKSVVALARRLQDLLVRRGFAPDLESSWSAGVNSIRPFRPHVTLARKVRRPPRALDIDPMAWSFTDFVLVDSKTLPEGSVYTVLEGFPLGH